MPTTTRSRRLPAAFALATALLAGAVISPSAGAATPGDAAYVRALYADILDRTDVNTDPSGVNFWANRVPTTGRAAVVNGIMFAPQSEYFRFQVELYYNVYLERSADPAGFSYFVGQWQSGAKSQEELVAFLVGSNEFYNRSGGTADAFVTRAYFDILGRQPDAAGLAYFKGVAERRGRGGMARVLLATGESLRAEVNYKYQNFLERPPTAGELSTAVSQRQQGQRFEALDVLLVASAEYYTKNSAG